MQSDAESDNGNAEDDGGNDGGGRGRGTEEAQLLVVLTEFAEILDGLARRLPREAEWRQALLSIRRTVLGDIAMLRERYPGGES